MAELKFNDLPMIASEEQLRDVHNTAGRFLVKRGGKAHSSMTCSHNEDTLFVNNRDWRIATDVQVRALRIPWCEDCDT